MFPTTPAAINFSVRCGATFQQVLTWISGGTPIDFTGYSGELLVWDADGEPVFDVTGAPAVGLTSQGVMTLTLSAEQTGGASPTCGNYRVTLTDSLGQVSDWLTGSFTLTE